jgi:hypothetical protein
VGPKSKQWLEATEFKITDYKQFESEFLFMWWSSAQQGMSKCSLYQSRYDEKTGLSLSAHFLNYATLASYLEPKLTNGDIISYQVTLLSGNTEVANVQ